jgi:hypothetical protein
LDLEEYNLHFNTMAIVADATNWRQVATDLIGDEEVQFKAKDLKRRYPLVRITSEDKSALDRVLTKAAESGD